MHLLSRRWLILASCIGICVSPAGVTDAAAATEAMHVDDGSTSDLTQKSSCDVQLFNILNPSGEHAAMNDNLYLQDLIQYNENPLAFLTSRVESCGGGTTRNFASLGRLIIGEHNDVTQIIQLSQVRGAFLGRARVNLDRLAPNFLLSLSDPGTDTDDGRTGIHQILHDFIWLDTIAKAQIRVQQEDVKLVLASYIDRLVSEVIIESGGIDKDVDPSVTKRLSEEFTCRYLMKALFDLEVDDELVTNLRRLWQTPGYAIAAILDPSPVSSGQYAEIKQTQEQLSDLIQNSPSLADYSPSVKNNNLSKKEWADELVPIFGIAALGGGRNLVDNLFTQIPRDYIARIDESKHDDIAAAVLEAGRIKSPVNNINIILSEPTPFYIRGEPITFPNGTVVAASLGLGSLDPKVFPAPHAFDHTRSNLMSQILNYNNIGYHPTDDGARVCPGRNIAITMAADVLKAWLLRHKSRDEDVLGSDDDATDVTSPAFALPVSTLVRATSEVALVVLALVFID